MEASTTKAAHTPGPWQIGGQFDGKTFVNAGRNCIAKCDHGDVTPPLDHAANARLIAAAPELLSNLQTLYHTLLELDVDGLTAHAAPMEEARAGIAKATGAA